MPTRRWYWLDPDPEKPSVLLKCQCGREFTSIQSMTNPRHELIEIGLWFLPHVTIVGTIVHRPKVFKTITA